MRSAKTLIDEAIEICGSQAALAKRLGMQQQDIHKLATGKRPFSPEVIGLLCDVVGVEPTESQRMALAAVIENPKNASKAEVLRRAFFVSLTGFAVACGVLLPHRESAAEGQIRSAPTSPPARANPENWSVRSVYYVKSATRLLRAWARFTARQLAGPVAYTT